MKLETIQDEALAEFYRTCDKKELKKVFEKDKYAMAEYEPDFLGFLGQYWCLSRLIPKGWAVVDLGCANGFQAEFFRGHRKYVGIEVSDCVFYQTKNSIYRKERIREFLNSNECRMLDPDETFAICNYVPDEKEVEMARKYFKNIFVYYPSWDG